MKPIKATFTGMVSSDKYVKGREYNFLLAQVESNTSVYVYNEQIKIVFTYATMGDFLDNWTNVSVHDPAQPVKEIIDVSVRKTTSHDIALAEAQLLGFDRGRAGTSIRTLCSEMGLTYHEWQTMQKQYGLEYLKEEDRKEIDEYFNS